ncbi:hypothetical protein ACIO7M_11835 [Streptomyces toxytricini]|uniref:Integral membrane protein n=1 Tax=Streptomyces toxytricini TaxID=67369 RepID=A0ABW8EIT2_STRT5
MDELALDDRYALSVGCRVSVESRAGITTVNWSVARLSSLDMRRPRQGEASVAFSCPRCHRDFTATVESAAKARRKRMVYLVIGSVLLLSLLVTLPMAFHLGGQVREEDDPSMNPMAVLVPLVAVGFIAGLTFFRFGRRYEGIRKYRLVRPDGKRTILVQGHRFD